MAKVQQRNASGLTIIADKLDTISEEILCFFIFKKQKLGDDFKFIFEKPSDNIQRLLKDSELLCEVTITE